MDDTAAVMNDQLEATTDESVLVCPDCSNPLSMPEQIEIGMVIVCENCGAELEVINTDPVEVDFLMIEK